MYPCASEQWIMFHIASYFQHGGQKACAKYFPITTWIKLTWELKTIFHGLKWTYLNSFKSLHRFNFLKSVSACSLFFEFKWVWNIAQRQNGALWGEKNHDFFKQENNKFYLQKPHSFFWHSLIPPNKVTTPVLFFYL